MILCDDIEPGEGQEVECLVSGYMCGCSQVGPGYWYWIGPVGS